MSDPTALALPLDLERGHGFVPDPDGHQVTHVSHLLDRIGAPAKTPDVVDFRASEVIGDQSIAEGCVGFRIKIAIETLFRRRGLPLPELSGYSLWTWARMIDHPGEELLNIGCSPNQAFRALHEWGIATLEAWPEDPGIMNERPTLERRVSARGFTFAGDYEIAADSRAETVDLLRRCLASFVPVTLALCSGPRFKAYRGGLLTPDDGDPNHYVGLDGYYTRPDGSTVFRPANQWGPFWGEGGFAEVDESAVDGWQAIRALDVRRAA